MLRRGAVANLRRLHLFGNYLKHHTNISHSKFFTSQMLAITLLQCKVISHEILLKYIGLLTHLRLETIKHVIFGRFALNRYNTVTLN
ncbi:hypothetical protein S2091_0781 [Solimicrobium silvestre]|uniref:Uncharacterized protein n=1 Tax=Solimicrobium silvestre TaxID=2099400 RepID=A0A2S9H478_9BURK|nr:hypothetical protein S2091_0781 [Solimicrobium silvestre]